MLFGTTGTAQAVGPALQPLAVGAARIAVGALLLAAIALACGAVRVGAGPRAVLLAGACVAVYQASFFAALDQTGVAVGTVVAIGSAPAFAGLFARAFAGEPLRARWAAATGLACAGVCLLVLGGGGAAGGKVSTAGVGLALVAGAGYAGYAVATKRMLAAGGAPEAIMAAVFGVGALMLLPVFALVPAGGLLAHRTASRSRSTSARFRLRSPTSCSPVGSGRSGRGRPRRSRSRSRSRRRCWA